MPEDPLVQKNIRVRESLWKRIEAVVGPRGVSEFLREAAEEKLHPIELVRRVEELERRAGDV